MTYRKLLDLYKDGKLDELQSEQVKNDIERHEAISEYLFDEDSIPDFELTESVNTSDTKDNKDSEKEFVAMINNSIRQAFIKMGITIGIILLTILMLVIFVLPNGVDMLFYDPSTVTGERDGITTNKMSLDLAIYTELFKPTNYREQVEVSEKGYGCYDVTINQTSSFTGSFNNISGKIKRGKISLDDDRLFYQLSTNAFLPSLSGVNGSYSGEGASGDAEMAMETLQNLNDNEYYVGYVTLNYVKSYSNFIEWCENSEIYPNWCAVTPMGKIDNYDGAGEGYYYTEHIGFIPATSCSNLAYDNEKYPYLTQFDMALTRPDSEWFYDEDVMTTHFVSMLRYMNDNKDFCKMIENESYDYEFERIANDVEKNGLYTYGFAIIAPKDELLKISENSDVCYIHIEDYNG